MNQEMPTSTGQNVLSFTGAVIETLRQELEALVLLESALGAEFDALRRRDLEGMEQHAHRTTEAVSRLERIGQARERQGRLLHRMLLPMVERASLGQMIDALEELPGAEASAAELREAYGQVRRQAQFTQQQGEELAFTLQYAARLTQDVVRTLHDLQASPGLRVYTAQGCPAQAAGSRSMMNRVG